MDRIPKDMGYFDLFEEIASVAHRASKAFCSHESPEIKKRMLESLEHEGDALEAEVRDRLDRHQDPPIRGGPDDIYRLVDNIDSIIDSLKKAGTRIVLYELDYFPEFIEMGELIMTATQKIEETLPLFRKKSEKNRNKIRDLCIEIGNVEANGDDTEVACISSLRKQEKQGTLSVIDFFLAKEVIALLEHALNQCEDASSFMETLKKKNA